MQACALSLCGCGVLRARHTEARRRAHQAPRLRGAWLARSAGSQGCLRGPLWFSALHARAVLRSSFTTPPPSHRFAFPTLSRLRPGLLQVQCRILLAERSLCFRGGAAAARSRQAAAAPRTCRAVRASQLTPRAFQWPRRQLPPSTTTPCLGACCWSLLRVSVSEGTSERRSSAY